MVELSGPSKNCADQIIAAIAADNHDAAFDLFRFSWKAGVSRKERGDLRDFLNETVLFAQSLEMTAHGVKKTFRFWTEAEKAAYLRFARLVCDDIANLMCPNVCIGYGAALAIGRSNDLIPHDDDLDIVVALPVDKFPTFADGLNHAETALRGKGYKVIGDYVTHRHLIDRETGFSIDFFIGADEDRYFSSYPGPRKSLHMETVFPAIERELFGVAIPLPRALESYLRQVYGETWETPDPSFSHNWDKKPFHPLL